MAARAPVAHKVSWGVLAPALALLLLIGATLIGLVVVVVGMLGLLPGLATTPGFASIETLIGDPRLASSILSTLLCGLPAALVSLLLALALVAAIDPLGERRHPLAVAILAMPHVALAIGLAFLLAPSGWILRATGLFDVPPDQQLPSALAMGLGLVLKETPFLFVAAVTGLRDLKPLRQLRVAQSLGYGPHLAWIKVVLPQLYPRLRFPVLAVVAYALSVVDMSLILGPTTPPTLPVLILRWANDPDIGQRAVAAAGAVLQAALVAVTLLFWRLGESVIVHLTRPWLTAGRRHWPSRLARCGRYGLRGVAALALVLIGLAIASLLTWSVAQSWPYPALLPNAYSVLAWQRALGGLWLPLAHSFALAVISTSLALTLAIACLEHEQNLRGDVVRRAEKWLFLPLLVPEVSFLAGLQILLILIGGNGTVAAVAALHLIFVFPYVFLALKEAWRSFDPRLVHAALTLGASPRSVLWRVKLPILAGSIAWAAAIGAIVSLSLYLPTVLGGEGRVPTLATEAVALSAGGDRRIASVYGLLQTSTAAVCFLLAVLATRRVRR